MPLDLSVLMEEKISSRLKKSIDTFFTANEFYEDDYCYSSADEEIALDVYINSEPEKDEIWSDGEIEVIGFAPMTEIVLESRQNRKSHELNYQMAKQLANLVNGVIYDSQVAVFYDYRGKPYACLRTDNKFEEYGAGASVFMDGMNIASDVIDEMEDNGWVQVLKCEMCGAELQDDDDTYCEDCKATMGGGAAAHHMAEQIWKNEKKDDAESE